MVLSSVTINILQINDFDRVSVHGKTMYTLKQLAFTSLDNIAIKVYLNDDDILNELQIIFI